MPMNPNLIPLTPAFNGVIGYNIAKELARQCVRHFGAVRGLGAGIGSASCCAAVAVVPSPPPLGHGYPAIPGQPYAVAFGNSQMARRGLIPILGPIGGHAERAALNNAFNDNLNLYLPLPNNVVMFVELCPCPPCQGWLGGAANPYAAAMPGVNLNIFYRWAFPLAHPTAPIHGKYGMVEFHDLTVPQQLLQITAQW